MVIKDKKKFRRTIIIIVAILLLFTIVIIKGMNNKYKTIEDFKNEKQVLEYLGCNYIRTESSKDKEYKQKIYVKFNKDLYENGKSNERFFQNLIQMVTVVSKYKSTILTDTQKDITIKIKCDQYEMQNYYINDIENYFAKQDSNNGISKYQEEFETRMIINSSIIKQAINKKWIYKEIDFGSKESEFENYNIYFDEGIKVRVVNNKVFNIVFNSNYTKPVVDSITVGTKIGNVKEILGTPTYSNDLNKIIGYKNKDIYVFFTNEEISIYRVENEYKDNFYKLLERFANSEIDFQSFTNELTTLWIDYDEYANIDTYYSLNYTLKGVSIKVTPEDKDGVHLYNNYLGLRNNEDLQKFIDSGKVHIDTSTNSVFNSELKRISAEENLEFSYIDYINNMEKDKPESNLFYHKIYKYDNGTIYKIGFLSKDNKNASNELKEEINSYVWYNDTIFLYGKSQDGIYAYDVENRTSKKLLSGQDEFQIKGIEDNKLKYDDKSVKIQ